MAPIIGYSRTFGGYSQNFVDNQGSAYLSSSPGASNSQQFTLAFTINPNVLPGAYRSIFLANRSGGEGVQVSMRDTNILEATVRSTSGSVLWAVNTGAFTFSTGTAYTVVISGDFSPATPTVTLEVNGVDRATTAVGPNQGTIGLDGTGWNILSGASGVPDYNVSDFYFETGAQRAASNFYPVQSLIGLGSPLYLLGDTMTADERDGNTSQGWNDSYNIGSASVTTNNTFLDA